MLKADQLTCRRGKYLIFRDLDFAVKAGGLMLITGRNGSGKSSLLRILAGLLPAFSGQIAWQGKTIHDFTPYRANLRYIGHLDALKPELTVFETIAYWHALNGEKAPGKNNLERFNLEALQAVKVRYLSAGQKRRLALTRLTLSDALLWLLDEPTTALDQAGQKLLTGLIAQHRAKGGLAIVAAHHHEGFANAQSLALDEIAA